MKWYGIKVSALKRKSMLLTKLLLMEEAVDGPLKEKVRKHLFVFNKILTKLP